ncbi:MULTISPECIES: hypothetical protein [unclassified Caballeronia]|nr:MULTISPECIES: hypothetical protein [unclassified Caballeronia]MDR5752557.1 hypothetical protein [Caballeronia sp. LZ024]MDR5841713.1 hypothetical protein [Caballeronia sp. LZ031]
MITNSQVATRLVRASTSLRKGSVRAASLIGNEKAGKKVQMSWGSAMRR